MLGGIGGSLAVGLTSAFEAAGVTNAGVNTFLGDTSAAAITATLAALISGNPDGNYCQITAGIANGGMDSVFSYYYLDGSAYQYAFDYVFGFAACLS